MTSEGAQTYVYGSNNLPIEQISSGGTVTYLHHDQAGSTRLLTGSTGTVTGKCSYSAYGTPTCEGTATTLLGFDTIGVVAVGERLDAMAHADHPYISSRPDCRRS
jgi:hypothetical protein